MTAIERAQDEENEDEYEVEDDDDEALGDIGFLNRHLSSQLGPTLLKRRGSFLKQIQSSGLMLTRGFRRGATDEGELDETIFTVSALTANTSGWSCELQYFYGVGTEPHKQTHSLVHLC